MGEQGILLPDKPVQASRLIIKFAAPGSAEFITSVEGVVTPAQKYVAAGWLASLDAKDFVFTASDSQSVESTLVLDFGAPGSARFIPTLVGQVIRNQLYSAAGWLHWAADTDFLADAQLRAHMARAEMQQEQTVQQLLRREGQRH